MNTELSQLIARAESVLARVEALFPPIEPDPDWKKVTAARWRKRGGRGYLQRVVHPHAIALSDLPRKLPRGGLEDRHVLQPRLSHLLCRLTDRCGTIRARGAVD